MSLRLLTCPFNDFVKPIRGGNLGPASWNEKIERFLMMPRRNGTARLTSVVAKGGNMLLAPLRGAQPSCSAFDKR
jgi:hypothetical protein